jgi:hypothetical protein
MWKLLVFANEVRKHWGTLVTSGAFIGSLYIWQGTGHAVPSWIYWTIALAGLIVACFKAWAAEYGKVESLGRERNIPELILQYKDHFRNDLTNSGFFLRVEGERKASNVEISSKETVGENHVQLEMRWSNPGHPIGNTAVPVTAECVYLKNGMNHLYHSRMGDQIYTFFDHKRDNPRELIVTLNYTDVGGHVCPAREFRVYQNGPDGKISCEPVKDRAASSM